MDIRMPRLDGIEATTRIAADERQGRQGGDPHHVETDENVFAALRAGASGFLVKDTEPLSCCGPFASSRAVTRCYPQA